jgi:VanZ family protein
MDDPGQTSLPPYSGTRRRLTAAALPAAGVLALLLLLALGKPPDDSFLWRTVYDLGHVPLFGAIALLVLWIVRRVVAPQAGEWEQVMLALLATAVLSLVAEVAQIGQPGRDADVGDAIHNLTGAVCFVALAAALRPGPWRAAGQAGLMASRLVLIGAVLALAIAFSPMAPARCPRRPGSRTAGLGGHAGQDGGPCPLPGRPLARNRHPRAVARLVGLRPPALQGLVRPARARAAERANR